MEAIPGSMGTAGSRRVPLASAYVGADPTASWSHRVTGLGNVSTAHLPPLPDLAPLPGAVCHPKIKPTSHRLTRRIPAEVQPANAALAEEHNHNSPARVPSTPPKLRAGGGQPLQVKADSKMVGPQEVCTISVVSALNGNLLATVVLPRTAAVANLKLEIEKVTGHSTFQMRFISDDYKAEEWSAQDFDCLDMVIGDSSSITLALLLTQHHDDLDNAALPFLACEREYLPASGSPDDAINLSRWRYRSLQEVC